MIYNCIKTTTTSAAIGTGNGTVVATAAARARPLADIPVGTQVALRIEDDAGTAWELSLCTILSATTFSRDIVINGSSGPDQKVNFGAGTKTVQQVLTADEINALTGVFDVPFSQSVPLARAGQAFMQQRAVSGPLTFAPAAAAVRGALVYLRLTADGINVPDFSNFKEWGGSLGYDNRAGIVNQVQFFYDGAEAFVSISQAVGAAPIADTTAPTMAGSISQTNVSDSGFTVSWQAATDAVGVTSYEFSSNGGASYANIGNVLSRTLTGLASSTPYECRVRALDAAGNRSAPLSTTVTTAAPQTGTPATVPGAPTIGAATSGDGYVDVAFTAPSSNGGAVITGYTATLSTGESATGASSPIRVSASNGTARTATVRATNNVGTGAASAASNSVTPQAAALADYPRLAGLVQLTESGGNPYSYTGTGGSYSSTIGGSSEKSLPAGVDGWVTFKVTAPTEVIAGFAGQSALSVWGSWRFGIYAQGGASGLPSSYRKIRNGTNSINAAGLAPAAGDILRISREGNFLVIGLARAASPNTFVEMERVDHGSSPQFWLQLLCTNSASVQLLNQSGFV